jgi:hypothetical protein
MQQACASAGQNYSPSIDDLRLVGSEDRSRNNIGHTLEAFIADRVLGCHEGYVTDTSMDQSLERLFFNRSAPISAAIAITIDLPD